MYVCIYIYIYMLFPAGEVLGARPQALKTAAGLNNNNNNKKKKKNNN